MTIFSNLASYTNYWKTFLRLIATNVFGAADHFRYSDGNYSFLYTFKDRGDLYSLNNLAKATIC
jgi:hypothetical protein